MTDVELVKEALKAREKAYAPYSTHKVGAALETTEGKLYLGCNIENAAYTPTSCAERTAFFTAVYEGERSFKRIAVVGGLEEATKLGLCAPCGVCRQVMMEFCDPKTFEIILAEVEGESIIPKKYTLEELLPLGFGPSALNK